MKTYVETDRLILREIIPEDGAIMFEMDSDPLVHQYLGNHPVTLSAETERAIAFIRQQYVDNGIGRWAVIEKASGHFLGWAGFKLIDTMTNHHIRYHDLGYRFLRKYWGRGYATEAAIALVAYGFEELRLTEIYAIADSDNKGSRHVLEKAGLQFVEHFIYEGKPHDWYKISKIT